MDRIIRFLRRSIHRILFFNIYGSKVKLYGVPTLITPKNILFKGSAHINDRVLLHAAEKITIGNNVTISYGTAIITESYDLSSYENVINKLHKAKPIVIGDNVWIGANSIILPGVQIPDNVIIGAGSVVTKSIKESYCIYAGNPARLIKKIER